VYPVTGQVLLGGKPLARASLAFHPADQSMPTPLGSVEADGTFQLTTYEDGDGAPAGDYAITIEWRRLATLDDEKPPPNTLPARYADPKTSGLTAKISAGENVLPAFQLSR
jgi:hypothetical protein